MCVSVKKSVTEAFNQHENAQKLCEEALMQTNKWPVVNDAPKRLDDQLTKSTSRSLDLKPITPTDLQLAAANSQEKDSGDSDSSIDRLSVRKYGPRLSFAKRVRSLPADYHMSTKNLLSAEDRQASSAAELAEVRLDIKP